MELKNNQIEKSLQLLEVVKNYGIAYLWGEVRSGKTGTALNVAKLLGVKNTLIITKKRLFLTLKSSIKILALHLIYGLLIMKAYIRLIMILIL